MALVQKPLDNQSFTMWPTPSAGSRGTGNVEFFGWRQEQVQPNRNVYRVVTRNFAEFSGADGQVIVDHDRLQQNNQWLVIARKEGRLAYLGFTHVWHSQRYDAQPSATRVMFISDRPVYRPIKR